VSNIKTQNKMERIGHARRFKAFPARAIRGRRPEFQNNSRIQMCAS
jgi:hypothetical protein